MPTVGANGDVGAGKMMERTSCRARGTADAGTELAVMGPPHGRSRTMPWKAAARCSHDLCPGAAPIAVKRSLRGGTTVTPCFAAAVKSGGVAGVMGRGRVQKLGFARLDWMRALGCAQKRARKTGLLMRRYPAHFCLLATPGVGRLTQGLPG